LLSFACRLARYSNRAENSAHSMSLLPFLTLPAAAPGCRGGALRAAGRRSGGAVLADGKGAPARSGALRRRSVVGRLAAGVGMDDGAELAGLLAHRGGRSGGLLDQRGVLLGGLVHRRNGLVDPVQSGGLLGAGVGEVAGRAGQLRGIDQRGRQPRHVGAVSFHGGGQFFIETVDTLLVGAQYMLGLPGAQFLQIMLERLNGYAVGQPFARQRALGAVDVAHAPQRADARQHGQASTSAKAASSLLVAARFCRNVLLDPWTGRVGL